MEHVTIHMMHPNLLDLVIIGDIDYVKALVLRHFTDGEINVAQLPQ